MKKNSEKLSVNLIANLVAFVVHAGIQFFVVPVLSEQVGNEAYGFISIANEFVQYANIFTVLLNGVVGRFVAYEIHKGEIKRANQYFNSVLVADIIISAVFTIAGILFVLNAEHVLVISSDLVADVKILFALTFLNFTLVTLFSVMNVATFVKNRIDIAAIRNIVGYLIEMLVVVVLFIFRPMVKSYFLIIGTLVSTCYLSAANIIITLRLTPELHVSAHDFNYGMMRNLLKTGGWSAVSQLSGTLLGSTVLILGNLFLGGNVIGLISLSKTIPNCLNTFYYAIYNVFTPNMVKHYAKGNIEDMVKQGRDAMRIMTFIILPVVMGVFVFIPDFFKLWLSGKTAAELSVIGMYCRIVVFGLIIQMPTMPLMYFAVATNKVKEDTLFVLVSSAVLLGVSYVGMRFFSRGGEIIVLAQTINVVIKFLFWEPMYAAKTVQKKRATFYPCYFRCLLTTLAVFVCFEGIRFITEIETWSNLGVVAVIAGIAGYGICLVTLFSTEQRMMLLTKIKKMILRS